MEHRANIIIALCLSYIGISYVFSCTVLMFSGRSSRAFQAFLRGLVYIVTQIIYFRRRVSVDIKAAEKGGKPANKHFL